MICTMFDIIWFKSITCITFTLEHYAENGILCDEFAGPYLLTHIGGTCAPVVNILIISVIQIKHLDKLHYKGAVLNKHYV